MSRTRLVGQRDALKGYFERLLVETAPEPAIPRKRAAPGSVASQPETPVVDAAKPPQSAPSRQPRPDPAPPNAYCRFGAVGLALAIPKSRIAGEVSFPDGISAPRGPEWCRTVFLDGREIRVVDTATMVLPAGKIPPGSRLKTAARKLIMMDQGDWALVSETDAESVNIESGEVHWRSDAGLRPWLGGTVASRKLAVLHLDEIRRMIGLE